ncbi:hypothetical protein EYF80_029810 [Liparis tanakae]|uniref:Uncharacterized protein n=1 Tax=Liparis tanakae TaxID=230148 RepID=A0A4Z2H269_9TELE|nr:hypothetical protein EYF80_029810 [Liparis tanakae]
MHLSESKEPRGSSSCRLMSDGMQQDLVPYAQRVVGVMGASALLLNPSISHRDPPVMLLPGGRVISQKRGNHGALNVDEVERAEDGRGATRRNTRSTSERRGRRQGKDRHNYRGETQVYGMRH